MSNNVNAPAAPGAPAQATQEATTDGHAQTVVEEVVDLDKLDSFMFQGKKYTPEELGRAQMRHDDYTRKTQETAKERKFFMNLSADLSAVGENPKLEASFKQVYPPEFHQFLSLVQKGSRAQSAVQEDAFETDEADLPKSVLEKLKRIDALEAKLGRLDELDRTFKERESQSVDKHLDTLFSKFEDKFPYAVEDTVLNRAQALIDANRDNPRFRMTEAAWERLFRQSSDEHFKKFEAKYKSQVSNQMEKSQRGSDSAPGGQAPGQPPKRMTIREAALAMEQDLRNRGTR